MSTKLRFWFALLILCSASTPWLSAQESPTDSIRLSRPIPVTIRMSNNAVVKTTLMGMDQDSIMTMNQQGRTVDYSFNKIRSLRSQDGSIFFTPSKDTASDLIAQLSTQQSTVAANSGRSGAHNGFTGGHGQMPAYPSPPSFPPTTHNQSHSPTYDPPPSIPPTTHDSHMPSPPPYMPPQSHTPHGPMHSQMPAPPTMPNMGHAPTNNQMGQQMVLEYTCTNCGHKFTSATEVKAGHRCTKCGVVWGEIHDENGQTLSTSPAAKVGSSIGGLALVIGIIVAIVRKVQSS